MHELKRLREDFLGLVDFDKYGLDKQTFKNILKGTIKDFFDYLESKLENSNLS